MKKNIILLFIMVLAFQGYTQVSGYLGSRIFLSVNGSLTPDYKTYFFDNRYDSRFKIRTPFSADLNFVASDNLSLGTKFSFGKSSGNFTSVTYDDNYFYSGIADYQTKFFSIFVEGHRRSSYSVIDNYYRVGLCMASLKNTEYPYTAVSSYYSNLVSCDFPETAKVFALGQKTSMFGIYYEFGNRVPLSNHLLFLYSLSGYVFPDRGTIYTDANYVRVSNSSSNTFIRDLGKRRVANSNMFNLNFGLTWAF
ncbi:MAG: hypothetical protein A2W93_00230 [Bacteroidetes bacterium GWF2_43_63]|nr:MAG: hypothetical protein A2W94_13290 [Bacteroidetes bacterium GWE2_42_42]OFY53833.1 MAG: hypothetical protein A2W93_00230 [Bacteroidetes bacterium GWF2_43_63]HBG69789.1 hypothetical protein [Bacteroidales bacterium]HCB61013.1 hypothetical protein [Bacteroidales bacterium]HCY24569.1 hypothetical protein [Bacteroidales bacterium]